MHVSDISSLNSQTPMRRFEPSASAGHLHPDHLTPLAVSADSLDARDGFDSWNEEFGVVHDVDVPARRPAYVDASCRNWRLGPVLFGEYRTPARPVIRTQRHLRDDIDYIYVRVVRTGEIRTRSADRALVFGPGEIALGSCANTCEEEQADGEWVTVIVDRRALPDPVQRSLLPDVLRGAAAAMLADFLLSLGKRLESATLEDVPHVERIVMAMLSSCLVAALVTDPSRPGVGRDIIVRKRVEDIIQEHLSSPRLTPGRIADLAGISRSTLYRMFADEGGVARYLLLRRLESIRLDLETPGLAEVPIAGLAERRGLHNLASFHRAFRRHFARTPGEIRAAMRRASIPAGPASPTSASVTI